MMTIDGMSREELIELLNRSWMTHDGMWFYHCFRECGIETANRVNKAAIRSLAPMEVARMKKALGITKEKMESFAEFKIFFAQAARLCIPPFMNGTMDTSRENVLHWAFAPKNCFAYKGMVRIGAAENYECGVIYRLACWFDALGLAWRVEPQISGCRMLAGDTCEGDFVFDFGQAASS
jgi:hypothetical protein